ncbi:MAG: FHA domain-containing protein [Chloroflexi bacterium]|nr:FHA domain-containing protein [Chloroflexota bacterium]
MPSGGALGDMLDIEVVASGRRVQWIGISELLIGRADLACGVDPDLDLEPDGGLKGGVSRRHCRVYRQQGVYLVEDVGSANGTYLNGERLSAYLPRILKHHDELQLGGMLLRVTIDEGAARM